MFFFLNQNRVESDWSERDLSDKTIRIWEFPFSWKLESYVKKTAENLLNFNDAEDRIFSKLWKILIGYSNRIIYGLEPRLG